MIPAGVESNRVGIRRRVPWRWRYLRAVGGTLVGALGVDLATVLARAWARAVFDLRPPLRAKVELNLREALGPASDPDRRRRIAKGAFESVAAFWVEILFLRRKLTVENWRRYVRIREPSQWSTLAGSGRPLLLVTGYLGNPVVAACVLSDILGPVYVLVDAASRLLIEMLWPRQLSRSGRLIRFPGLYVLDADRAGEELPTILEAGGRVLVLAGPGPATPGGHTVSFLGRPIRQPATVSRLAHRHDADIVVFACPRRSGRAFRFELQLANRFVAADRPKTAGTTTRRFIRCLEDAVRGCMEQYLWTR